MAQVKPTISVTGNAGYIGSHVALALNRARYGIIVLDNLEYGHRELVENSLKVELVVGGLSDRTLLNRLLADLGKRDSISIGGTDYPTPDGICLRDYIHVSDFKSSRMLGTGINAVINKVM